MFYRAKDEGTFEEVRGSATEKYRSSKVDFGKQI